jgi:hypothetical protein
LWHGFGAPATFLTGAMFTILALVGLFLRPPRNEAGLPSRRSTLR